MKLPVPVKAEAHRLLRDDPRMPVVRYSLDPRFVGHRAERRVSQTEVRAIALDSGELVPRHERTFARHVTIPRSSMPERCAKQRDPQVEVRALEHYDRLIPA